MRRRETLALHAAGYSIQPLRKTAMRLHALASGCEIKQLLRGRKSKMLKQYMANEALTFVLRQILGRWTPARIYIM